MFFRSFLFLIVMVTSTASSAAIISFNYTGSWMGGDATVSGIFGYDTAVADSLPGDTMEGEYIGSGFWSGVVAGGPQDGASFNFTNIDFSVLNDDPDLFDSLSCTVPSATGSTTYFDLENSDATAFSDDSLPTSLNLDDFNFRQFTLGSELGVPDVMYEYEFNSIEPLSAVPLPPAVWLFGSALLGFVSLSRKR